MTEEKNRIEGNPLYDIKNHKKVVIVAKGLKDGYYWHILSLGSHPCAYVAVPKGHPCYDKGYDELYNMDIDIDCHGGLTYANNDPSWNPIKMDYTWFGWDYAHSGDYSNYETFIPTYNKDNKVWTVKEIKKEVMSVIKQFKKLE